DRQWQERHRRRARPRSPWPGRPRLPRVDNTPISTASMLVLVYWGQAAGSASARETMVTRRNEGDGPRTRRLGVSSTLAVVMVVMAACGGYSKTKPASS